jgi:two-component system sensor histidine kinase GlrK
MSFARPRSIVRLILLGFAAVAVPLIAAVITAVIQVDRLAASSRQAVLDAGAATQESRAIAENLTAMERSLGQYYVLADRDFYRSYLGRRGAFNAAAQQLAALNLGDEQRQRLTQLLAAERRVNQKLLGTRGEPNLVDPSAVSPAFADLHERAREILAESSKRITFEANRTREGSAKLQRTLLLQAAAVVPVALILAGIFVVLITRPLRQIDNEIRRLGSGSFSAPVAVRGPRDLQELGLRLDWLRRRVLDLEEQKTTFLQHISHELKTPLTSIREGAQLLLDDSARGLNEEQKEIALILRDSSQQLQRLIEDLLEFGKRSVPRLETPPRERVALDEIVRKALDSHALGRTAKNLRVRTHLTPAAVAGDANQLRIVVDNLLSNAIKYTPASGEIQVVLTVEEEAQGENERDHKGDDNGGVERGTITLEVADSGPGVDTDERERVFEPFYQGRAPYVGPVQGTGLGLTIARQYVHAHDGSIEILEATTSGHGARVRVRLPGYRHGVGQGLPPQEATPV